MICPGCGAKKMCVVTDVRDRADGTTYRRRKCTLCGYRFSTREKVEDGEPETGRKRASACAFEKTMEAGQREKGNRANPWTKAGGETRT